MRDSPALSPLSSLFATVLCLCVTSCTGSRSRSPRCLFTSCLFTQSHPPGRDQNMSSLRFGSPGRTNRPCLELRVPVFRECPQALECLTLANHPEDAWPGTRQLSSRWVELGRTVRSGLKGKSTQAPFFPLGLSPSQLTLQHLKLSHPWVACCSHSSPEEVSKVGAPTSEGDGVPGHLPPAGVGRGRAGSSQEAQDGAERRPHKSQTEVPSSRARAQTRSTDSKAKVRREPWEGAGLLEDDGWRPVCRPTAQSVSPRKSSWGLQPL